MALLSRHAIILSAIAATLNRDSEISSRNFSVRKKAYNRGTTWQPGAWVTPENTYDVGNENRRDEIGYGMFVTVVDPNDADLEDNLNDHLAVIERVEDIFRSKSNGYLPQELQSAITSTNADSTMTLNRVEVTPGKRFIDPAFEAGFDASACLLKVFVRVPRRSVESL